MHWTRWSLLIIFLFSLFGCDSRPEVFELRFHAMGTVVDLSIAEKRSQKDLEAIARLVEEDFRIMHAAWHPWEAGPLGRVNQLLPLKGRFSTSPAVIELIRRATPLSIQSGGLFNPAIGRLIQLWGFDQEGGFGGPPPPRQALASWLKASVSMSDISVDGMSIRSHNDQLRLDFGAFAKGVAVDKVIEHLQDLGVRHAIVNAGGDLRAIGTRFGQPWKIGIRDPSGEGVLAGVDISGDLSVFTSGDYERYFDYEGQRYHHILDPRTGYPATGTHSVTVLHTSAAVADAAATALFIAGPQDWRAVADAMEIEYVLLVDSEKGLHMTDAMRDRIRLLPGHGYHETP